MLRDDSFSIANSVSSAGSSLFAKIRSTGTCISFRLQSVLCVLAWNRTTISAFGGRCLIHYTTRTGYSSGSLAKFCFLSKQKQKHASVSHSRSSRTKSKLRLFRQRAACRFLPGVLEYPDVHASQRHAGRRPRGHVPRCLRCRHRSSSRSEISGNLLLFE